MKKNEFKKWILYTFLYVTTIISIFYVLDVFISKKNNIVWLDGNAWATIIIGAISF